MNETKKKQKKGNSAPLLLSTRSIGFRLIRSFIAVIVIVLLAISVFTIVRWKSRTHTTLMSKGETMARLLAGSARSGIVSGNNDQLRDAAAGFAAVRDILFVGIYDAEGKPLYLSDPAFAQSNPFPEKKVNAGAIGEKVPLAEGRELEFSKPVMLAGPASGAARSFAGDRAKGSQEHVIGYVTVVLGRESLNNELRKIITQSAVIALVFICASIAVVSLWVRKITRPLESLTRAIRALGRGSEVTQVPVETRDEIGRLAEAFNAMLDERKVAEQTRKNILRDLHDGVGGMMTNIIMLSEITRTRPLSEEVAGTLATISALSREGIDEIRNLIYSLDRRDLNWSFLSAEMRSQGNKIVEPHAIAFEMVSDLEDGAAEPGSLLCLHLFRDLPRVAHQCRKARPGNEDLRAHGRGE